MELLTGLVPKTGLAHVVWLGLEADVVTALPHENVTATFAPMHAALEGIWAQAVEAQQRRRARNARARPQRYLPDAQIGNLVLVAQSVPTDKLQLAWTGPFRVVGAPNKFVYEVQLLNGDGRGGRRQVVHIARLRTFSNGDLGTEADIDGLRRAVTQDFPDNFIQKKFLGHRVDEEHDVFMLKVRWLGWGVAFDTEEPVHNMVEAAPHMVEDYLYQHAEEAVCDRYLRKYFGK